MREYLSRHEFGKHKGFRWRNASEISRIEGFSDAVFAFAVTLLVVSLEVPKTFDELMAGMHGFLPFAAAFSILFIIWLEQYRWFRQYGLQDGPWLWLNAALLFVVLFFTYPLKFLFTWLFSAWTGGRANCAPGEWRDGAGWAGGYADGDLRAGVSGGVSGAVFAALAGVAVKGGIGIDTAGGVYY